MTEKVLIGGTPIFENPFSNCTFLGRLGSYDLYLTQVPGKAADVLARSGSEPGEYVEGMKHAWGVNKALTAARRIAEYKKLLPFDAVKSLLWAHEPEDLASIRRGLPATKEFALLTAYQAGDAAGVAQVLGELVDSEAMVAKYPQDLAERLAHVRMNVYLVGRFLSNHFTPDVYVNASKA